MRKVVINTCFGGFGLSKLAQSAVAERKGVKVEDVHYYDLERDDADLVAAAGEIVREFAADESAADHRNGFLAGDCRAEMRVVSEIVDGQHAIGSIAADREPDLVGPEGEHEFRILQRFLIEVDRVLRGFDGGHLHVRPYGCVELRGHLLGRVHRDRFRRFAGAERAREHRLGIKVRAVRGENRERHGFIELAQFAGDVWATDRGVIMRVVGDVAYNGHRTDLSAVFRNVRETRQDPNLFELPGGYRRVIVPLENVQQILESMSRFGAPR